MESSYPVPGQPFKIHMESMEAQLATEAAAPPLHHFDDYDKENDVPTPAVEENQNPLQGITIRPIAVLRESIQDQDLECEDGSAGYINREEYFSDAIQSLIGTRSYDRVDEFGEPAAEEPANSQVE